MQTGEIKSIKNEKTMVIKIKKENVKDLEKLCGMIEFCKEAKEEEIEKFEQSKTKRKKCI